MSEYNELQQLGFAYKSLKSQPREAQIRMLQWLGDKLAEEHYAAIKEREASAKKRVASGKIGGQEK